MIPWIAPEEPLPSPDGALTEPDGLLAAGADLGADRLQEAYRKGIFPWYTQGQPVLWWSPDPRLVLFLQDFRLHRSLRKRARALRRAGTWRLSIDRAFDAVMRACAEPRSDQDGTWITEEMIAAYCTLHARGIAHSVELWEVPPPGDDSESRSLRASVPGSRAGERLVAGLYGVAIGRMFFGESMFTRVDDGSKIALAGLVAALRQAGFSVIDCQQSTRHLRSLGAVEIPRVRFLTILRSLAMQPDADWDALQIDLPDA